MDRQNPGQYPPSRQPGRVPQSPRRTPGQHPGQSGMPQNPRRDDPAEGERQPETLLEKFHGWRLGISIEVEPIIRALVCLVLISFFALLQTTLFTRFQPFGAVPDLMLPLVVAISMIAREKWGAVSGILAAFVIESLGGVSVTILSLLYMPVGYVCGLLTVYYFRDGFAVRALYTGVTALARVLFSLLVLVLSKPSVSLPDAALYVMIPEFFATVAFSFLPHLAVKYAFRLTEGKAK
ncbi:MAG: hypothetical protein II979_05645 [Clostridia bacterium]|nr:hypothetical protein [Clostridia bacterium]